MGRKSKLKEMRRLAKELPQINQMERVSERLTGAELRNLGIEKTDDDKAIPISDNKLFKRITTRDKPVNHERQLKEQYNKHGVAGVRAYIKAVQDFSKDMLAKGKDSQGNDLPAPQPSQDPSSETPAQ